MNILYINHYAGSPALGMEYRPYYLAREWVRAGHAVQILAADCSHVRARQPVPPAASEASWDECNDGIRYRWYATPPYDGNGLGRVRNIATFLRAVWADSARLVQDFKPEESEDRLYHLVSDYLQRDNLQALPASQRNDVQSAKIQACFLEKYAPEAIEQARQRLVELQELKQQRKSIKFILKEQQIGL